MGLMGGLGGQGALPADNTPAQRKSPLNPPPQAPPLFKLDISFSRTPPPLHQGIVAPKISNIRFWLA